MRCTRLRRMYLPRKVKKDERDHPMQVKNSETFLKTAFVVGTATFIAALLMSLRQVQLRRRRTGQEVLRKRSGQRVVVIGAGAAGSATAASLTNTSPDVHVTVIEKERQHTFLGHVPMAHTGHRSYDLGTTTGTDMTRSPASWNVTREADLVAAEVLRIDPEAKRVFVRTTTFMLNAAKPLSEAEERASAAPPSGLIAKWLPWIRGGGSGSAALPATLSINADGSHNLSDGTTVFPYDALVVAAGAQRSTGHLRGIIPPEMLDSYGIAINTGTTRDSLASMFSGNVLHVKVPPASFVWQMEAARALIGRRSPCATVDMTAEGRAAALSAARASAISSNASSSELISWEDATLVTRVTAAVRDQWTTLWGGPAGDAAAGTGGAVIPDEVALQLRTPTQPPSPSSSSSSTSPLSSLASWCMHFSSRQHDSTFISTTNTIWKYLSYFNKLNHCPLFAITADAQPCDAAPPQMNSAVELFWRERQLRCRIGDDDATGNRFHVLYHAYMSAVDSVANVVTLYDYKNNAEVRLPYTLLVLDLPLRAPGFVRRSGLHRTRYVDECVRPALREGTREVETASAGAAAGAASSTVLALQRHPLLGKTTSELEAIFADESSFMDVDAATLQHRRYRDIFAIGDVAGLPSVKGYGAVYAQVPVVSHNVRQVLKAQKLEAAAAAAPVKDGPAATIPCANARYTGYSSFHVVMTTWRAMWPEMEYAYDTTDRAPVATLPPAVVAEALQKAQYDVVAPLRHYDHHLWNNLTWRDPRGFLNAFYYQASLYELMFYFIFTRGQWHSPTWFAVPDFAEEDGTRHVPSLWDLI